MGLDLDRHLAHWRRQGLVSDELAERLRAASAELVPAEWAVPWVRWALATLGGGLVLAGLALVLAENWNHLHRFTKLALWLAIYLLLLVLGRRADARVGDRPFLAEALSAVAGGWLLAGIALVGWIYHLSSRPADGYWLWLALAAPVAWVTVRRAPTLVCFAALVAAWGAEATDAASWFGRASGQAPWLWLTVPCLAALGVSFWPRPVAWLPDLVGVWWLVVAQCFLLVFGASQDLAHGELGRAGWVVGATLVATLLWPRRVLPESWGGLETRLVVVLSLLPWVLVGRRYDSAESLDVVAVGLAWVLQLGLAVLWIRAGARSGRALWINLGFLAILVGILVRYFDFFGDRLDGGLAVALTGVLILIVVAVLERQRRRLLATPEVRG